MYQYTPPATIRTARTIPPYRSICFLCSPTYSTVWPTSRANLSDLSSLRVNLSKTTSPAGKFQNSTLVADASGSVNPRRHRSAHERWRSPPMMKERGTVPARNRQRQRPDLSALAQILANSIDKKFNLAAARAQVNVEMFPV